MHFSVSLEDIAPIWSCLELPVPEDWSIVVSIQWDRHWVALLIHLWWFFLCNPKSDWSEHPSVFVCCKKCDLSFLCFFSFCVFFCCQQFDFCGDIFWSNVENDSSERPSVFICCVCLVYLLYLCVFLLLILLANKNTSLWRFFLEQRWEWLEWAPKCAGRTSVGQETPWQTHITAGEETQIQKEKIYWTYHFGTKHTLLRVKHTPLERHLGKHTSLQGGKHK